MRFSSVGTTQTSTRLPRALMRGPCAALAASSTPENTIVWLSSHDQRSTGHEMRIARPTTWSNGTKPEDEPEEEPAPEDEPEPEPTSTD